MNFPLLVCSNCKNSDKESFLLLKGYKIKNNNNFITEENKKEELLTTSDDNNNTTNNLEIIDYPYSSNNNQDETFQINSNNINFKTEPNYKFLNNDIKKENLFQISRNNNKIPINNSSSVIKNEDSLTENKILLKNLYINYNNKNFNDEINKINENKIPLTDNNSKDSNIGKKFQKNIKNKKLYNKEKDNIEYKNNRNIIGVKVEYPSPDSENFISKSNNLIDSQMMNTDVQSNRKNEKNLKINLKKNINVSKKISLNKDFNIKSTKNSNVNKKNIKLNNKNVKLNNRNNNIKNKNEIIKNKNENIKIKTENIKNKNENITNKNIKKIRLNIKNDLVSEIGKINKEKLLNTYKLYTDNKINILFKKKLTTIKSKRNSKLKNISTSRKTTEKSDTKYKPYLSFRALNPSKNISAPFTKITRMRIHKENFKKLLLLKFNQSNYHCRNTILDYSDKNYKYTNILSLRKKRNTDRSLTSKTYLNPFEIA